MYYFLMIYINRNMSYYQTIEGINYDRKLLDLARSKIVGRGDGRISHEDTSDIIAAIEDKNTITKVEFLTIFYIINNFSFTSKALETLAEALSTKIQLE